MKIFDDVTRQVRFYLSENHYCHSLIKANERCFRSLEAYLKEKGVDYSPEIAKKWIEDPDYYASSTDRPHWKMALVRLKDIYEHGEILTEHDTRHLMSYTVLYEGLRNSLDSYLESLKGRFSEETIDGHKHPCARFLIYIQKTESTLLLTSLMRPSVSFTVQICIVGILKRVIQMQRYPQ